MKENMKNNIDIVKRLDLGYFRRFHTSRRQIDDYIIILNSVYVTIVCVCFVVESLSFIPFEVIKEMADTLREIYT